MDLNELLRASYHFHRFHSFHLYYQLSSQSMAIGSLSIMDFIHRVLRYFAGVRRAENERATHERRRKQNRHKHKDKGKTTTKAKHTKNEKPSASSKSKSQSNSRNKLRKPPPAGAGSSSRTKNKDEPKKRHHGRGLTGGSPPRETGESLVQRIRKGTSKK